MRLGIACALLLAFVVSVRTPHPERAGPVARLDPPAEVPLTAVQLLARRLHTGDLLDRQDAAYALAAYGPDAAAAIPELLGALDSVALRRPAEQALLTLGPPGWEALEDHRPGWYRWRMAQAALGKWAALPEAQAGLVDLGDAVLPWPRLPVQEFAFGLGVKYPFGPRVFRVAPSPLAVPALMLALGNSDPHQRMLVAERLETLGPLATPAIPALLAVLDDPWPLQEPPALGGGIYTRYGPTYSVRISAVQALLATGSAGADALARDGLARLIAGLQTDNFDVRLHTGRALALLGPLALPAAPRLAAEMRRARREDERLTENPFAEAMFALGPDAVPALAPLLDDGNDAVRAEALRVISNLGPRARPHIGLVRALLRPSRRPCAAGTVLARIAPDDPATVAELSAAVQYDGHPDAIEALGLLGPRARAAVPILIEWLARLRQDYRPALTALERIGLTRAEVAARIRAVALAAPALAWLPAEGPPGQAYLRDLATRQEPRSRLGVAHLLCQLHPDLARHAVPVFVEYLETIPRPQLGDTTLTDVVATLSQLGPEARPALPAVRAHLDNEDALPWTAPLLARLEPLDPAVVPTLLALLAYPEHHQRHRAAEELGRLGPAARRALPSLERALSDEVNEVRSFALVALLRITNDHDRYAPRLRRAVADTPSVSAALAALGREWPWTQAALLDALRRPAHRLHPQEAWPHFSGRTESAAIQVAAARALAAWGPAARPAVPELVRLLEAEMVQRPSVRDRDLVTACANTLAAVGPRPARPCRVCTTSR